MSGSRLALLLQGALVALRGSMPIGFRYRGFAPRRPASLPEEVALMAELQTEVLASARGPLWCSLLSDDAELVAQLLLRLVRLALVEELSLSRVVGRDGRTVPASRGALLAKRALRRLRDEAQEARAPVPWETWDIRRAAALERLARHCASRLQALVAAHLAPLRPPRSERRRAEDSAAWIAAAIEAGRRWS